MKKFVIVILVFVNIFVLLTTVSAASNRRFVADEVDFKIVINRIEQKFNLPVVSVEGRTYIPIREFCDAIGYDIDWDQEGKLVSITDKNDVAFKDDISATREGTLDNGRKFIFYGTDKQNFNLANYLEKMKLINSTTYDFKVKGETVKALAEKAQLYMGLVNTPPAAAGININYDVDSNSLMFTVDLYGAVKAGGLSVLVISCDDGTMTEYNDGLC